jgi:Tat protein translocase TatB subunit
VPSSLGAPEILVILVVALIVLGPSKLPEAGRQVGKALAEVRRWSQTMQSEIRDVIDIDPDPPSPTPPPVATPPAPPTPPAPATPPTPTPPEPTPPEPSPSIPTLPTSPGEPPPTMSTPTMSTPTMSTPTMSAPAPAANGVVAHAPDAAPEPAGDESSPGGHPAG